MFNNLRLSLVRAASLALGIAIGTAGATMMSDSVSAQERPFPDVSSDYWAQPFIQRLAQRNVVVGYPDGTYRPEQVIERDEFAAMIRQAFDRERVREIPSGSAFRDVPQGYWAAPPIQDAYEMGFMRSFEGNRFFPRREMPRVNALAALARGLNLTYDRPAVATATPQVIDPLPSPAQPNLMARNPLMFPLASTVLMQPFFNRMAPPPLPPAMLAIAPVITSSRRAAPQAMAFLQNQYRDARQVPGDAVEPVAAATQANIVVNYPNVDLLNPNAPLTRGAAAAFIHQAMVHQGRIEPLSDDVTAAQYIVNPAQREQTAQVAP